MHLDDYLQDLETRIDESVEEELLARWKDFAGNRFRGEVFVPKRPKAAPPKIPWPNVLINDALEDDDLMALSQFAGCSRTLETAGGLLLTVRANYGSSILPSLFGARVFLMDRETDTLPTTVPFGDLDAVRRLLERGVPDLRQGFGERAFEMGRRFAAIQRRYPKVGKHVHVYHPDLQGAMDACEVLWGSRLFSDIVDHPDLVNRLLDLICEVYIAFQREWERIFPPAADGLAFHWGMLHRGRIMLRTDSAMNFSPRMFDEFIRPREQRLLDAFGGGAVHFCGRGDHYIAGVSSMRGVSSVAMSQPRLNNMEIIYRNTVDKGISLIGFDPEWAARALASGRKLRGRVQCESEPHLKSALKSA